MSNTHSLSVSAALTRALELHQGGNLADAEEIYCDILAKEPDNADASHLLGLIKLASGNFEQAEDSIKAAIRVAPQNAVFHFNLGNTQRRSGKTQAAIASYRQALELNPNDPDTLNNLAQALADIDDRAGALSCLQKAHAAHPGDAQIACNLGELLFEMDCIAESEGAFRAALLADPTLAEAHNNLGAVAQSLGDNERAAEHYRRALEVEPNFAHAHKNLAGVLHLLGQRDDAILHYRAALQLEPDMEDAAYELAALEGSARAAPPQHYVAGVFNQYAHEYDAHMTGVLGYAVPSKLRNLAAPHLPSRPLSVLDLGCGTGLSGIVFKDIASALTGIDLAPKMIEKARERAIYDHLRVGDIITEIDALQSRFDLVIAADVFVYIGDLDKVFGAVRHALNEDGLFLFSVEHADAESYLLREAGRYAHSPAYINSLTTRHGLRQLAWNPTELRKDFGREIIGDLYLFSTATTLR